MKQRICRDPGCQTILSAYNTGDRCWPHTISFLQTEKRGKRRYVSRRGIMSSEFLANVEGAYRLTRADKESLK